MIKRAFEFYKRHHHIHWALIDQSMVSGVNFLTGILLARFLGIEEFGRFTLAWMAVLFFNSILHSMINNPMMSVGPKQDAAEAPAYYGAVMAQQAAFSVATFVLLLAGVNLAVVVFPEWRVEGLALPLAAAAVAFQFQDFLRRYFFTRGRPVVAFVSDAVRYLGQIAVLAWLFLSFQDEVHAIMVLWVIALMAIISFAGSVFFLGAIQFDWKIIHATINRHWLLAKWLGGTAILNWTLGNFFIIVAGAMLGAAAVGALKAAQNIMGITHILFLGLENVVPAKAASLLKKAGPDAMFSYFKKMTLFGGFITALIAITAAAAPEFWLGLAFGEEYVEYGFLLRWFAVVYILIFLATMLRFALRTLEYTKPIFWAYLWSGLFSLVAAIPMIEYLGLLGVVSGKIVIEIILVLALWVCFSRMLRSRRHQAESNNN